MSDNVAFLLDACGTKLTGMDALLGRATERLGVYDTQEAQKAIGEAHRLLGAAGLALAGVAAAVLPKAPVIDRPTGLRPGQVVGDVGGGSSGQLPPEHFNGPLNPAELEVEDWRVYHQNPYLWRKNGEIFSSNESGAPLAQDSGSMTIYVDLAAYKAKGGKLAPWLS